VVQVRAQTPATPIWQVTSFDIAANVQQNERLLNVVATINATNVGGPGRTLTVRINSKASVKSVTVSGGATNFRPGQSRAEICSASRSRCRRSVAPNAPCHAAVTYTLAVESNTGLTAISPIATQFLPLAFWYPMPNTPYSVRGADAAPFRLTVNIPNAISSGVEKQVRQDRSLLNSRCMDSRSLCRATGTNSKALPTAKASSYCSRRAPARKNANEPKR
jgi:hypothetical protein